jgi:uncharacterized iron-regulated membrane protein
MSGTGGFWQRPQSVGWRRALFQVHLWTGLAIGLYILVISLSGSAIVLRQELDKAFCPHIVLVKPSGPRLSPAQFMAAVQRALGHRLPDFDPALVQVRGPRVPGAAVEIWYPLGAQRGRLERLIDPYSGKDDGDTIACEPRAVSRLADLHDQLLGGDVGELVNGAGGVLLLVMSLSGMVIWWPGRSRWWRSLSLRSGVGWRRFTWDLHSALGFWLSLLLLMWSFSAIYLAFPSLFYRTADLLGAHDLGPGQTDPFDVAIDWMVRLHFGRTFGNGVKVLWVVLGLAPATLIVTGTLMWWNRVVRRVMGRAGESLQERAQDVPSRASPEPDLQPASLPGSVDLSS